MGWQQAVDKTVTGMGYELVDCERSAGGLLRISIDRVPGQMYITGESEFVLVEDCEQVTRQLQRVLEVENCDYARLEVSSPGLDRPLKTEAHYLRFVGLEIDVTLKVAFLGRKNYRGFLRVAEEVPASSAEAAAEALPLERGLELVFKDGKEDKVLGFVLSEVREARLVPVVDFKGRKRGSAQTPQTSELAADGAHESGGHEE